MANLRLLHTACTVALLAAAPAFAQSNTPPADTGAGGAPNTPTTHEAMPGAATAKPPAHVMHRSAMAHHMTHASAKSTSQDAAVDHLNDQSYQAAQQGQSYGAAPAAAAPASPAPASKM